jgi:hypothetical protein
MQIEDCSRRVAASLTITNEVHMLNSCQLAAQHAHMDTNIDKAWDHL